MAEEFPVRRYIHKKGGLNLGEEGLIEAILFSAGRAVGIDEFTNLTAMSGDIIRKHLEKLILRYAEKDSGLEISKAGEKYAMQVKAEYAENVVKVAPKEIPEHLLRTLALIAYHQPIKQVEMQKLIGSKIYDHVKELEELGMIRAREDGRTKILTTSKLFPEYFGIGATSREEIKKVLGEKVKG